LVAGLLTTPGSAPRHLTSGPATGRRLRCWRRQTAATPTLGQRPGPAPESAATRRRPHGRHRPGAAPATNLRLSPRGRTPPTDAACPVPRLRRWRGAATGSTPVSRLTDRRPPL